MTVVVNDALKGVYRDKKEIISVEDLLKRIDGLEHTIAALKMTNSQLAEALTAEQTKSIPGTKLQQKFSYID